MHCNFESNDLLLACITGVILITEHERQVFHAINAIWLSLTVFRHDESRESESVPSISIFCFLFPRFRIMGIFPPFCVLGLWVIFLPFRVLGLWVIFRGSSV